MADWPGERCILILHDRQKAYPYGYLLSVSTCSLRCIQTKNFLWKKFAALPWNDRDFVHDYGLIIGAIMALKTSLPVSALQSLHREHETLEVKEVLRPLSSVLTGVLDEGRYTCHFVTFWRVALNTQPKRASKLTKKAIASDSLK
jgi:hypothetical protein